MLVALILCAPLAACTNWHDGHVTIQSRDCEKETCLDSTMTPGTCNAAGNGSRYIMFHVMNASTQSARYRLEYNTAEILPTQPGVPDRMTLDRGDSQTHTFWSSTYDKDVTVSVIQLRPDGVVVEEQKVTERLPRC